MIITFDTNILVYATADERTCKSRRARDLIVRGMRSGRGMLLLQALAEFSTVAMRKSGIPVAKILRIVDAWRDVLPVQAADENDLTAALDAVETHRLNFWDAMLWASAQRVGVRQLFTEDLQDGFSLQGVTFINPFNRQNDGRIDEILPP